jgi:hypothetical protein
VSRLILINSHAIHPTQRLSSHFQIGNEQFCRRALTIYHERESLIS